VRTGFVDYQQNISAFLNQVQAVVREWWSEVRGDRGAGASASAIGYAVAVVGGIVIGAFLFVWTGRRIVKLRVWQAIADWLYRRHATSIIEFYDRMLRILASKGLVREPHQTPLEFAYAVGMPEAVSVTKKYNLVRFGEHKLSADEASEIDSWLRQISTAETSTSRQ
jgi:hypothetical protein